MPRESAQSEGIGPLPDQSSHVVIAITDTGINPYHPEFTATSIPREAKPTDAHSATYLDGYPSDAKPLNLSCHSQASLDTRNCQIDFADLPTGKLQWIPGTRIIGAISFDDKQYWGPTPILDDSGHGTMTASVAAGATLGACPECLIVVVEGMGPQALEWAASQPWIDVISNSWGVSHAGNHDAAEVEAAVYSSKAFAESGGVVIFSAKTDTGRTQSGEDAFTGVDWHVVVGAATGNGTPLHAHGETPMLSVPVPGDWMVACSRNLTRDCRATGTSAAAAYAAGALGQLLLDARRLVGDDAVGPRAAVDGIGVLVEGRPQPGNQYLADGTLAREDLLAIMARHTQNSPGAPGEPGGGVDAHGYGLLGTGEVEAARTALVCGLDVPERAEADKAWEADSLRRRQQWGEWNGTLLARAVGHDGHAQGGASEEAGNC